MLLRAEQRLAESTIAYYRSLVDYSLAIRDVHFAKGSLLEYDGVSLAEGPWSTDAYREALERSRHYGDRIIDYGLDQPRPISRGPYLQHQGRPAEGGAAGELPYEPVETPSPTKTPAGATDEGGPESGSPPLPPPPTK